MSTHQRCSDLDLAEVVGHALVLVLTCISAGCGLSFEPEPARHTPARLSCPRCDGLVFTAELDLPLGLLLGVGADEPVPFVLGRAGPGGDGGPVLSEPPSVDLDRLAEVWAAHLTRLDTDAQHLTRRARELEQRGESRAALELRTEAAAARVIAEYMRVNVPTGTTDQEAPDA